MPSHSAYKYHMSQRRGNTVGESLRIQSNQIMEANWFTDPQSKIGYLYDYYHDDFDENGNTLNRGMTYENTNKTEVYVKHVFDTYGSMAKDDPEMYVQFMPSFKLDCFTEDDEMYYFKTDYQDRYSSIPFCGMYIDLPDPDRGGIYEKYLICKADKSNMFQKYMILKCDYNLQYIEINDGRRLKRHIWGATRSQNS